MPKIEWNYTVVSHEFKSHPSPSFDAADAEIRKDFPKAYFDRTDINSRVCATYYETRDDSECGGDPICFVVSGPM